MSSKFYKSLMASLAVAALFFLPSCFKDKVGHHYTLTIPTYKTLRQVYSEMKLQAVKPITSVGKIYVQDKYLFATEPGNGVHVFNNANPSHPIPVGFVPIPGNQDIAVRGDVLYADAQGSLVGLDISDPQNIKPKYLLTGAFDYGMGYGDTRNPDSILVVISYTTKDTIVYNDQPILTPIDYLNCRPCGVAFSAVPNKNTGNGKGGSTARFAVIGDYLYAVDFFSLKAFDIHGNGEPTFSSTQPVDTHIETIYPFKDKLFIGGNIGMYMYDVSSTPGKPDSLGQFTHVRACDPVITDGNYAYVTLRDGTSCLGIANELEIIDISSLTDPKLVNTYPLHRPEGLSKEGNLLFICDADQGLKLFDASNVNNIKPVSQVQDVDATDIITWNGTAIVLAADGIYQYDYSNDNKLTFLSKIRISQ